MILLNMAYKMFAILLNKGLIEIKLVDNQMRFQPNRSTTDNIFIIRQIFEKSHDHNIDLYNICGILQGLIGITSTV
jgi:hypothetical protein